jgi:hypothetical protein
MFVRDSGMKENKALQPSKKSVDFVKKRESIYIYVQITLLLETKAICRALAF